MIHEPKLTPEIIKEIVRMQRYKNDGGKISCAHDVGTLISSKNVKPGDTVLCTRCYQYLAVVSDLPWVLERGQHQPIYEHNYHSNHLKDRKGWLIPVNVRIN